MTSKRDIRALKRENFRLKEENSTLIKKNRSLYGDNRYFAEFLNLIISITEDTKPYRKTFKLFH